MYISQVFILSEHELFQSHLYFALSLSYYFYILLSYVWITDYIGQISKDNLNFRTLVGVNHFYYRTLVSVGFRTLVSVDHFYYRTLVSVNHLQNTRKCRQRCDNPSKHAYLPTTSIYIYILYIEHV